MPRENFQQVHDDQECAEQSTTKLAAMQYMPIIAAVRANPTMETVDELQEQIRLLCRTSNNQMSGYLICECADIPEPVRNHLFQALGVPTSGLC